MTIKNQHRKGIARLSAMAFVVVGSFHFSASAQVQVESERNPSPKASRHYDRRYDLANRAEQAQFIRKMKAANTEVRFIPEKPMATEYLASTVEVTRADGTKASMTVEAAMYEYLKQFNKAMTEAKSSETSRSRGFQGEDQKINAKAFDAAVVRAGDAIGRFRVLVDESKSRTRESFGELYQLMKLGDMYPANATLKQVSSGSTLNAVFDIIDTRFPWIENDGVHGKGTKFQYDEFVTLQKNMKFQDYRDPKRQATTQLGIYLDQIRQVEAKGLEAPMKALKVDVANINPKAADAKELIRDAKRRQPVSLRIQAALKNAPRVPSGGPVALVVGAAGFAASSAVMAGEAETASETTATGKDSPAEFKRDWVRSGRPTSR